MLGCVTDYLGWSALLLAHFMLAQLVLAENSAPASCAGWYGFSELQSCTDTKSLLALH